jgi:hypothetical protein
MLKNLWGFIKNVSASLHLWLVKATLTWARSTAMFN